MLPADACAYCIGTQREEWTVPRIGNVRGNTYSVKTLLQLDRVRRLLEDVRAVYIALPRDDVVRIFRLPPCLSRSAECFSLRA